MEAEKSDYERLRDANIARNAAVMRALGLDDSDFMRHLARDAPKPAKKAPAKRKRDDGPARRSSRLASLEAEAKQPEEDEADEAAEPAPPTAAAHRAEAKAQRKQGASIVRRPRPVSRPRRRPGSRGAAAAITRVSRRRRGDDPGRTPE